MKISLKIKKGAAAAALASLCVLSACRNSGENHDHAVAEQLFQKSLRLIELYTDSMKNVSDSSSYRRMKNDFDEKLAKVNFQFPADTDLHLTQEENDSLAKILDKFVKLVKEKGEGLNANDSIPLDSVAPVMPSPKTL